jgi:hypothetical protein
MDEQLTHQPLVLASNVCTASAKTDAGLRPS